MGNGLESPYRHGTPDWDTLYRARCDEVTPFRPILTGDVFAQVDLPGSTGKIKPRTVIVMQHPCSMRANGVDLARYVLVAEVTKYTRILLESEWNSGFYNFMPLPVLRPKSDETNDNCTVCFDNLHSVESSMLQTRIAILSTFGINLLLQRWVHYCSRVIVPTYQFQEATGSFYEEADLIEEWCEESIQDVNSDAIYKATQDCVTWLRANREGQTYQNMLKDPQTRSYVRKKMREETERRLRGADANPTAHD